jgi:2-O-methyltransferase
VIDDSTTLPPITSGRYDLAQLPLLILNDKPVILDIGCNDGTHTSQFLKLFKNATVFSFEPDPRAQKRFKEQVTDPRATLFEMAISAEDGMVDFHVSGGLPRATELRARFPDGWDQSGSIRTPKKHLEVHPWCKFDQTIRIKTMRLDTWSEANHIGLIDFIWADVQGAEIDLITGGRNTLMRTCYLYTEYSNDELYEGQLNLRALLDLLPDFEVVYRFDNDVLLKNKIIEPTS